MDCSQAKKSALEEEDNYDSSDEEVKCTSIKLLPVALTLAKDLMLFLVEKGEEEAIEHQQKVISSLEDAKFKLHVFKKSTQTTLNHVYMFSYNNMSLNYHCKL